jgi:membrane protein implicated in regulation of membrane protease activity
VKRLRLVLSLLGFTAALLAVALENQRIGWAAIAILLVSLILRLLQRTPSRTHLDDERGD